ncbi:putative heme-binding protein 2-like isoform X2 [Apostichopus japonicus]|uniref:Putative heme-binding protein 2-like isoform X2 n=1 Tax=Stichopus japonicus TaxID=307972 RepID=A0A2G8KJ13_STIJA|nr:putative heme-binding protein 2-like isoform X2 [Apostichopus japonicus]
MFKAIRANLISSSILDCPKYTVVKEHEGFEERRYEPSVWTSVDSQKSMGLKENGSDQFFKLFRYIQGKNVEEQKIEMTIPVIRKVEPGPGPACESSVNTSFFVPPEFHDKPPQPKEEGVHTQTLPTMTVYASSFGGYANDESWLKESQKLAEKIPDPENIQQGFFYVAAYNSPWQFFNRTNEVWFVKLDQSEESNQTAEMAKE